MIFVICESKKLKKFTVAAASQPHKYVKKEKNTFIQWNKERMR